MIVNGLRKWAPIVVVVLSVTGGLIYFRPQASLIGDPSAFTDPLAGSTDAPLTITDVEDPASSLSTFDPFLASADPHKSDPKISSTPRERTAAPLPTADFGSLPESAGRLNRVQPRGTSTTSPRLPDPMPPENDPFADADPGKSSDPLMTSTGNRRAAQDRGMPTLPESEFDRLREEPRASRSRTGGSSGDAADRAPMSDFPADQDDPFAAADPNASRIPSSRDRASPALPERDFNSSREDSRGSRRGESPATRPSETVVPPDLPTNNDDPFAAADPGKSADPLMTSTGNRRAAQDRGMPTLPESEFDRLREEPRASRSRTGGSSGDAADRAPMSDFPADQDDPFAAADPNASRIPSSRDRASPALPERDFKSLREDPRGSRRGESPLPHPSETAAPSDLPTNNDDPFAAADPDAVRGARFPRHDQPLLEERPRLRRPADFETPPWSREESHPSTTPTPETSPRSRNLPRGPVAADQATQRWEAQLAAITDDTYGIRKSEAETLFETLRRSTRTSSATSADTSGSEVHYLSLMSDPVSHRGAVVTLEGDLWDLRPIVTPGNPTDLPKLWDAWIVTPDSGTRPYRVIAANWRGPTVVNRGQPLRVRATGHFFKRAGHLTPEGLASVPVVLAADLTPVRVASVPPSSSVKSGTAGLILAFGLIFSVTLGSLAWSERDRRPLHLAPVQFSSNIVDQPLETERSRIADLLRDMGDRDRDFERGVVRLNPAGRTPTKTAAREQVDLPTPLPPTLRLGGKSRRA